MRDIIAATARANGVDPALALAVSYQESGWNQRAVCVANAVGAMQVIPTDDDWISGVVGRRLNPLNARGTTPPPAWSCSRSSPSRRAATGRPWPATTRGSESVRENGMYPDTKRYVANVMALKAGGAEPDEP